MMKISSIVDFPPGVGMYWGSVCFSSLFGFQVYIFYQAGQTKWCVLFGITSQVPLSPAGIEWAMVGVSDARGDHDGYLAAKAQDKLIADKSDSYRGSNLDKTQFPVCHPAPSAYCNGQSSENNLKFCELKCRIVKSAARIYVYLQLAKNKQVLFRANLAYAAVVHRNRCLSHGPHRPNPPPLWLKIRQKKVSLWSLW